MAKGKVVFYQEPPRDASPGRSRRAGTAPARSVYTGAARRRRRRRRAHPLGGLLFALAALLLTSTVVYVLWYTHPSTQARLRGETAALDLPDGGDVTALEAALPAGEGGIVVAIDPGHGGVNPSIGAEDYGSESGGLRESEITLATARALCDLLEADGRFAPMLTADGTAYIKPSDRGAAAKAAGAQLLVSIHLNYDGNGTTNGFECYAAPPALSTNAESLRFGEIVAQGFSRLGLELRGANGVRYLYYENGDNKRIYETTDNSVHADHTFTVLETCGCPAVLCEEGFISHSGDMALLSGETGCAAAAQVYYEAICSFFSLSE